MKKIFFVLFFAVMTATIFAQEVYTFDVREKNELGVTVYDTTEITVSIFQELITIVGPDSLVFDSLEVRNANVEVNHRSNTYIGTMYKVKDLFGRNCMLFLSPDFLWISRYEEIYYKL